jgi:hypothetical protein
VRIAYEKWAPRGESAVIVQYANQIAIDYANQGYDLTLRQLYYQFVSRDLLPNTQKSYDRLGQIINRARLAGLMDWDHLVDRTRNIRSVAHWENPADIIDTVSRQFRLDKWSTAPTRIEVWVEKEALAGVVQRAADRNDVAWFSCRGYVSQSEMWAAGQRLREYIKVGQNVILLHLGDHDPSGIDMTRDITDRLRTFILQDWANNEMEETGAIKFRDIIASMDERCDGRTWFDVRRIALNYDQVQQYNPPPNPAKATDARFAKYLEEYGSESWELDALDPATLDALIESEIDDIIDPTLWDARVEEENTHRRLLKKTSAHWSDVVELLETEDETESDPS